MTADGKSAESSSGCREMSEPGYIGLKDDRDGQKKCQAKKTNNRIFIIDGFLNQRILEYEMTFEE